MVKDFGDWKKFDGDEDIHEFINSLKEMAERVPKYAEENGLNINDYQSKIIVRESNGHFTIAYKFTRK